MNNSAALWQNKEISRFYLNSSVCLKYVSETLKVDQPRCGRYTSFFIILPLRVPRNCQIFSGEKYILSFKERKKEEIFHFDDEI